MADYSSLFGAIAPSVLEVPEVEQDIGLYGAALKETRWDLACVLNSYSIICKPGWLADLSRRARDPRVGIVGATGSYESHFSAYLADVMANMAGLKLGLHLFRARILAKYWVWFPRFPNPHIRTNALMISREVFQRVRWPCNPSRMEALRFESGRRSLTRQVLRMGLDAIIVGRDGRSYGVPEWPSSDTFRQDQQDNLLVADNRTTEYSTAAPERRRQTCQRWHGAPMR